jgi:hypothetical protein
MSEEIVRGARSVTIRKRQFGYAVRPGTLTFDAAAGDGPNFVVRNRCGLTATVTFPQGVVVDADNNNAPITSFSLPDGQKKKLGVDLSQDNFFDYTVAIPAAGIEAVGGSRPDFEIVR